MQIFYAEKYKQPYISDSGARTPTLNQSATKKWAIRFLYAMEKEC
ncbi:MAG: hypothetical protein R2836_03930 [Chitinophagales bacterium]